MRTVDWDTLIPDETLSIEEGAVAPWNSLMWSIMTDVCREMGVRTHIPYQELTEEEKQSVPDGPMVKKHIYLKPKKNGQGGGGELDFTYYSAAETVRNALSKVRDEKGMKRVEKFLKEELCGSCGGTRLSEAARAPRLRGLSLADVCRLPLSELDAWVSAVPESLPEQMQLARAVRNRTTGVLYVLDEPSIGLHPSNVRGLAEVVHDLVRDGNSVVLVDHDTQILKEADWLVELGPRAGAAGGRILAQGTVDQIMADPLSQIGPFLGGTARVCRSGGAEDRQGLFSQGRIRLSTGRIHTVKPLQVELPRGRLTVVTGVSGSGKTTMVLESLVCALEAMTQGRRLPEHVSCLEAEGIRHVKLIDATPIGVNVRSTVATYAHVHDELRKRYARTAMAGKCGYKAGDFSYNTGSLRCPACDGTGSVSLDVQFLPDIEIDCPECRGSRYARATYRISYRNRQGHSCSLPELMGMDVNSALEFCTEMSTVRPKLKTLQDLGLGYLTLGENTPSLSGGEAQRLKLASEMGKSQADSVFVFDEPTIGLHPLDVQSLLGIFQTLIDQGATVVVIEHDLDLIRNADYVIDMGPGGGEDGGRIVACGTPEQIRTCPESVTGKYL